MLILAGVSLNAVIGDNGIITQAQNATYMQSVAVLEEFFNNYYVEHYEEMSKEENKIQLIKNLEPNWFYNGSPIGYIVDSDGNMHYFINKDGLPDDIKNQIRGGDAGDKTYRDYASMKDVYGITSELNVYYCENNEKILGTTEFDTDNPLRVVFEAGSDYAKLITGSETEEVTLEDIKGKKILTINKDSNITDLSELYKFISLTELNLDGVTLGNLNGVENLSYLTKLTFNDCTIEDYKVLNNLCNQIEEIYFINTTNNEIEKFCKNTSEVSFGNLRYFGIYSDSESGDASQINRVSDISSLSMLNENTKKAIISLKLNNNNITNIESLTDFINVEILSLTSNQITSLKGVENMNNIKSIDASNNKLGINEIYDTNTENSGKNSDIDALSSLGGKNNLSTLNLSYNRELKWISYIKDCRALTESLNLTGCNSLVIKDLTEIRELWNALESKAINSDKLIAFNSDDTISLASSNLIDDSEEFQSLYNKKKKKKLSLEGNTNLSDEKINEVLSTMENLKYLSLKNVTNFSNLDFIKEGSQLLEIDLRGTSCTDLENLKYCTNLVNLAVDNKDTDFTNIQSLINSLSTKNRIRAYWGNYVGFYSSFECAKNLNNCSNIETLDIFEWGSNDSGKVLDLSNCTGLKEIRGQNTYFTIKVPINLKIWNTSNNAAPDLSMARDITSFSEVALSYSQEKLDTLFKELSNCLNLDSIHLRIMSTKEYSLEYIGNLKNTSISSIILSDWNDGRGQKAFSSLEKIGAISTLTKLEVTNQKNLVSTKGIEELKNLQILNLSGSNITNLSGVENLQNLVEINLNYTDLYDTYVNETSKENLKTLDVLANLNYERNGSLRKVYLEGNSKITSWDSILNLSWENKSGF